MMIMVLVRQTTVVVVVLDAVLLTVLWALGSLVWISLRLSWQRA